MTIVSGGDFPYAYTVRRGGAIAVALFCVASRARADDPKPDDAEYVDIDAEPPRTKPTPGGVTFRALEPRTPAPAEPTPEQPIRRRPPFVLKGVHPFGGLVLMAGGGVPSGAPDSTYSRMSAGGEFLFGFRGGVLIDQHEVAIEVSPGTYAVDDHVYARSTPGCAVNPYNGTSCSGGPVFQLNGTYRYLFRLHAGRSTEIFWPLGIGIGVLKELNGQSQLAYFQATADVLGVSIRSDRLMIDLHFPSLRYGVTHGLMTVDDPSWTAPHCRSGGSTVACTPATVHMVSFLVGVGASYVF